MRSFCPGVLIRNLTAGVFIGAKWFQGAVLSKQAETDKPSRFDSSVPTKLLNFIML